MVIPVNSAAIRHLSISIFSILGGVVISQAAIAQTTVDDDLLAPLPSSSEPMEPEIMESGSEPIESEVLESEPADESLGEIDAPHSPSLLERPLILPPASIPPTQPEQSLPTSFNASGISNYLLGPGDQIGVSVIGFPEFERTQVILPDGTILLPLIGSVLASGRTLESLEAQITDELQVFLVEPVVDLNLSVLRPVVVTVGGEVSRPGPVQLNSLTSTNTTVGNNSRLTSSATAPTLSTALVAAGGVLRTADLRDIVVQRQLPNGRKTTVAINLWESILEGGDGNNVLLQDGDVVFVSAAPEQADIDPQLVARSSLAPDLVRVRVVGQVNRPGEIQVPPDSSISAAVAVAGGPNDDAKLSEVALLRLQDNGQVDGQTLDLRNLLNETPIQDGDVVVVPKRGFLNVLDAVGRTLQPITSPLNLFIRLFDVLDDN